MRRPLALFVLLLSLVGLTYAAAWRRPDLVPHIAAWLNHRHWLPATAAGAPNAADPFAPAMARLPRRLRPAIPPEKLITLRLKNGTVLSGELLSETPQAVTLGWAWGSTEFRRSEIAAIERCKRTAPEAELLPPLPTETGQVTWPYHHDVVVQLTNTQVIDARIAEVHPDRLVVQTTLPGGGRVEQEIDRQRVEQLLFRPVENARSQQLGQHSGLGARPGHQRTQAMARHLAREARPARITHGLSSGLSSPKTARVTSLPNRIWRGR